MIMFFENPRYLFLLLVIPLFILIHFTLSKRHKKKSLKFANFDAISRVSGAEFFSRNLTILYLSIVMILVLTFAASGLHIQVTKKASSFSFVVAIDSSFSMETKDISPEITRLQAAKTAAKNFVDATPISTKIGLISFSGVPVIEHEPTINSEPIKIAIDKIKVNRVGGTNFLNAIVIAGNLLWNEPSKSIVIISDGQINDDEVGDMIAYANRNGIVISTIGVGTVKGGETSIGYLSKLDEESLNSIAYETGGKSVLAQSQEEIDQAMEEILQITRKKVFIDLRFFLSFVAIIFYVILFWLSSSRYKTIP